MPSRCCEFVDSRLRRSPPDRASAVPMDKPGKTQCVSPTLPTGRRLPHKLHSTPQQHGMILISGNGEISSRLHAFSLFFPGSCPNNRDRRMLYNLVGVRLTPKRLRGEAGAFGEGAQFGPGEVYVDTAAEAAIGAGDDVLAADDP